MAKRGTLFEKVVADIVRSFDSTIEVEQGTWINGPDGRRDRDVSFTGMRDGLPFKVLIECKDYNPRRTGRVGIELIDALDSKRRDLNIDIPMICSNAGFAEPAIKKAQRVGIATIGALRKGDHRIKFQVHDAIYYRRLILATQYTAHYATARSEAATGPNPGTLSFDGLLAADWLTQKLQLLLLENPIVNTGLTGEFRFREPVTFDHPGGVVEVRALSLQCQVTGAWYKQNSQIDASSGFYDWVRKRVRIGGAGQSQLSKDLDFTKAELVHVPPDYALRPLATLPTEMDVNFVEMHGPIPSGPPLLSINLFCRPTSLDAYRRYRNLRIHRHLDSSLGRKLSSPVS